MSNVYHPSRGKEEIPQEPPETPERKMSKNFTTKGFGKGFLRSFTSTRGSVPASSLTTKESTKLARHMSTPPESPTEPDAQPDSSSFGKKQSTGRISNIKERLTRQKSTKSRPETKTDTIKLDRKTGDGLPMEVLYENEQEPVSSDPVEGLEETNQPQFDNTNPISGPFSIDSAIEDTTKQPDIIYKVIIIGNSGVGKTNLLGRWMTDKFEAKSATISTDVALKTFEVGGKLIKIQFWDTAGTEAHFSLTQSYFRKSHGAIIVYDVTQASTFFDVQKWVTAVKEIAGNESTQFLLVGNKSDLTNRDVSTAMGLEFARREQLNFIETSALNGNNVHRAFQIILQDIHKMSESVAGLPPLQGSIFDMITEGRTVSLDSDPNAKSDDSCCGADFSFTSLFS